MALILPKCQNKSSWNLLCISCHLSSSLWCSSCSTSISNTNAAAHQIVLFYWLHYVYILKFSFYFSYQILKLQWKESGQLVLLRSSCSIYECTVSLSVINFLKTFFFIFVFFGRSLTYCFLFMCSKKLGKNLVNFDISFVISFTSNNGQFSKNLLNKFKIIFLHHRKNGLTFMSCLIKLRATDLNHKFCSQSIQTVLTYVGIVSVLLFTYNCRIYNCEHWNYFACTIQNIGYVSFKAQDYSVTHGCCSL
jgi:hypothetical protein